MFLVEAPKVEVNEMAAAVRWKIKDLVDSPVDQLAITLFPLTEDAYRGQSEMVYVVATRKSLVRQVVDTVLMGEEVTGQFTLTARNVATSTTQNYIGDFAKLDTPAELSFFAIEDLPAGGDDVDYSTRLVPSVSNGYPADFSGDWVAGVIPLSGNLIFNRQAGGAPDGPFTSLQIAVTALDDDGVIDVGRNVDDDNGTIEPGPGLYNLIGIQEFRYGRLRLENAYSSEIP